MENWIMALEGWNVHFDTSVEQRRNHMAILTTEKIQNIQFRKFKQELSVKRILKAKTFFLRLTEVPD